MNIRNALVVVGCTAAVLGALAVPAWVDNAPGGSILASGSVQMVPPQQCRDSGGQPNYFGSHTVCEGGSHSGEYIPPKKQP